MKQAKSFQLRTCIFNRQAEQFEKNSNCHLKTCDITIHHLQYNRWSVQNSCLKLKANLTRSVHLDFHYVKSREIARVVTAEMGIILYHDKPDK